MESTGLYIHVPFCDGKCHYCAFYSVEAGSETVDRYLRAVPLELSIIRESFPSFTPETVYIGGGTPTLLSEEELERLLGYALDFGCDAADEWTVEANPGTLTDAKLGILMESGVTRISLGVQSFDDDVLARLGRRHSAQEVDDAVAAIRRVGFADMSIDLIAGIPGVTEADWQATLEKAVSIEPEHISVYALTEEEGTRLGTIGAAEMLGAPLDEEQLTALHAAQSILSEAGYGRYEISNYALPGSESQHNVSCWRGGEYIGVGPAAASHMGRLRWTNVDDVQAYADALEEGVSPVNDEETLSPETAAMEMLVFGLRMAEGVNLDAICARADVGGELRDKWVEVLSALSESALVARRNSHWVLTDRGRDLADYVALELME